MKRLSKPIFAIVLACTLFISTAVTSFATEMGDPGGGVKCSISLPYNTLNDIK